MICPNGHEVKQLVVESRHDGSSILRRRYCCECHLRYVTKESVFDGIIPAKVAKAKVKK